MKIAPEYRFWILSENNKAHSILRTQDRLSRGFKAKLQSQSIIIPLVDRGIDFSILFKQRHKWMFTYRTFTWSGIIYFYKNADCKLFMYANIASCWMQIVEIIRSSCAEYYWIDCFRNDKWWLPRLNVTPNSYINSIKMIIAVIEYAADFPFDKFQPCRIRHFGIVKNNPYPFHQHQTTRRE